MNKFLIVITHLNSEKERVYKRYSSMKEAMLEYKKKYPKAKVITVIPVNE